MGAGASAGALPDSVTLDEAKAYAGEGLSLIHISEPTRP